MDLPEAADTHATIQLLNGRGQLYTLAVPMDAIDPTWQEALRIHCDRVRREPALCTCTKPPQKLTVKKYDERRFLAIFPETGPKHDAACFYWRPDIEQSGRKGYVERVISHQQDNLLVSLRHGLVKNTPKEDAPEVRTGVRTGQPRTRHRAMTALGLLHLLWEEARVNHWHPKFDQRRWWPAVTAMRTQAGRIKVRQRGQEAATLANHAVIMPPTPGPRDRKATDEALWWRWTSEGTSRLVVIGKVSGFRQAPDAVRVAGVDRVYLNLAPDDLQRLQERFEQLQATSDQVVGLFIIQTRSRDKRNNMRCKVIDAGMMACTNALIPVDSRYEHQVAGQLIENGRRFYKPLRFDAAADAVLPDFVLLDTGEPYPMEVYGMDTPAYQARRAVKDDYYAEQFGGRCWSWEAVTGSPIPPFPARYFR